MTTLEKIMAEINDIDEGISSYHNDRQWIFKDEVLQIIDKYAGEPCEDAKSKKEIAKIVDELYENANEDQQWILCELYRKIIHLPNVQPKQEPCDDAISRDAVCEIINDIRDCISVEGYCAIIERMKKLPSVRPQEPKYCDRNICIKNEYNGISCDECEVGK